VSAHIYVWYRIAGDEADCERAIRGMMARLGCRSGVVGELQKKRDEARLWMEVYRDVGDPAAFQHRLAQAVDEFDVEMFVDGTRHTECFVADFTPPPCAAHP